jgi:chemotaxis protein methyltransferase CheR
MKDSEGVEFLQWCLPRLHLRWPGFRKVRRQVYRRLDRRFRELELSDVSAYRSYLESHAEEWLVLGGLCQITISRFYRDKAVFEFLEHQGVPDLAQHVLDRREQILRCWTIGCASGEEPYTLAIIWGLCLAHRYPELHFEIFATDVDPNVIERAQTACYPASSLKELPAPWVELAFDSSAGEFCVKKEFKKLVTFDLENILTTAPDVQFHLILCRNVAFTYFDEDSQREVLQKIKERLIPGGMLVIGGTESLSQGEREFEPWCEKFRVFRKSGKCCGIPGNC